MYFNFLSESLHFGTISIVAVLLRFDQVALVHFKIEKGL